MSRALLVPYRRPAARWPGGWPMRRPDGALVCSRCGLLFEAGYDRALFVHWQDCALDEDEDEDEGILRRHLVRVYHLDEDGEVESIELRIEDDDGDDDPEAA